MVPLNPVFGGLHFCHPIWGNYHVCQKIHLGQRPCEKLLHHEMGMLQQIHLDRSCRQNALFLAGEGVLNRILLLYPLDLNPQASCSKSRSMCPQQVYAKLLVPGGKLLMLTGNSEDLREVYLGKHQDEYTAL